MKGKNDPAFWILSLWTVGVILNLLHIGASLFLTWFVGMTIWSLSDKSPLAIVIELCVLVWMMSVSYVAHSQIRFSWNKLMVRELEKARIPPTV